MNPEAIILKCDLCPGDLVTLTAAVRDLQTAHRGRFRVDVRTNHPALWENNPHITPIADGAGRVIEMEYPLIHESNQGQHHFIHGYRKHLEDKLQLTIPAGAFKGDIHLTEEERNAEPILPRYWLIVAGGKLDFTAKWWDIRRWQEVVDALKGKVQFVQVGHRNDVHPPLKGVKNLTGKTSLRDLVNLVYHAEGVVCPVTAIMHLAAAVPTKTDRLRPCVVVAGGREPSHWEAYPGHTYLDTIGQLGCCATGGCWKSRVVALGDADEKDQSLCSYPVEIREGVHLPACLDLITPPMVVHAVVAYLRFADLIPGEPIAACAPCNATVLVPKPRGLPADRKVWGPQKWREFHGRAVNRLDVDKGTELVWLAKFTMSLPCEECRLHFVTFLLLHPPELQSVDVYRWWGIAAHNYVNVAIGAKPLSIEEAERSIDYNRNRTHAETHARTQTCVICPDLVRPTATEGARCGRTDEVLRLKLAGGTCDRWPDYAPPRAVAASAPGEIGLVIGTYGAVPYIHLQLESVRRFHPGMKVLVVDDCSPDAEALRKICAEYGAELHVNEKRMGHVPGDMQAFVTGHEWANRN